MAWFLSFVRVHAKHHAGVGSRGRAKEEGNIGAGNVVNFSIKSSTPARTNTQPTKEQSTAIAYFDVREVAWWDGHACTRSRISQGKKSPVGKKSLAWRLPWGLAS
jgi:hypothetical protein